MSVGNGQLPSRLESVSKETEEKMKKGKRRREDEGKLPIGRRFFKVLIPGFKKALGLPPVISRLLNNGEIPEAAILVSRKGSWRVDVGQCSKVLTFEGEGWDSFIQYHNLSVGDFIVFEHTGHMHFNTLVFDSTTCEKEFPRTLENVKDGGSGDDICEEGSADDIHEVVNGISREPGEATSSYLHKNASFRMTLHQYSVKRDQPFLFVPAQFLNSNDLSNKTAVTLINPSGDAWRVELKLRKARQHGRSFHRLLMSRGWDKFVEANKLKVGDTCIFELSNSLERTSNPVMNVKFCSV